MVPILAVLIVATKLHLEYDRKSHHYWIVDGQERLMLPEETGNWEWGLEQGDLTGWNLGNRLLAKRVPEGGNWELTNLALYENGTEVSRLDFGVMGARWLKDDDKWGGHKKANDLRYLTGRTWLGQLVVSPGEKPSFALGVLCAQNMSLSFQPIQTQALVRIDFTPRLKASFIRDIGYLHDRNRMNAPNIPRIFSIRGKLWVAAEEGIVPIDQDGHPGEAVFPIPKDYQPLSAVGNDYILFSDSPHNQLVGWSPKSPVTPIPMPAGFLDSGGMSASQTLPFFSCGNRVVDLMTGKSRVFKGEMLMFGKYAIEWDGKIAQVFEARTGKKITNLDSRTVQAQIPANREAE